MRYIILLLLFMPCGNSLHAQVDIPADTVRVVTLRDSSSAGQEAYDVVDAFRSIFPKKQTDDGIPAKRSGLSYLPNVNYNPSIGAQIGIKVVGGHVFGNPSNTAMSTFAAAMSYTTRGIMIGYLNHDIYTKENKWNLKGSLVLARMVGLDYGLGIGNIIQEPNEQEAVLNNPERMRYTYNYNVYNINERIYKKLAPGLFVGSGIFFEMKRQISLNGDGNISPNDIYSEWNGFESHKNNNNGLMFNVQYMTRDNPNNAYRGIYADLVLRANQQWMGSQQSAYQLVTDFRKYWPLSSTRSNHVLAFWSFGSFKLGKDFLPYLDLPGTAKDPQARSGRGYTLGYFKGLSFYYSELEYRFPILANRFLSGVVFANVQTANDQMGTNLFRQWQPAGGTGLRILFNKATRTNLCIDYAFGRFGQRGFFLGLNEAF